MLSGVAIAFGSSLPDIHPVMLPCKAPKLEVSMCGSRAAEHRGK